MRAIQRFEKRLKVGEFFPAFVFVSVTSECNLSCQGCWVKSDEPSELSVDELDSILTQSKAKGASFFGLLGGEPLLHRGLLDVIARHPDAYFQLFTNGTLLTEQVAMELRRLGNVTPLISVEGMEEVSDVRRGGRDVYARAMDAIDACKRQRLITGVATSVCASNYDDMVKDDFLRGLIKRGVDYAWYYIYRPVGPDPSPELCLTQEQILGLRRYIVDVRTRLPIMVIDAYWDDKGQALCPAAVGISHHIGPSGSLEPCPPIQLACESVRDGVPLDRAFADSPFLKKFREEAASISRGCILLESPGALVALAEEAGAHDSSGRGRVIG